MPADHGGQKNRDVPMISVLYVDDEEGLLEITKLFLEKDRTFAVSTAISAEEALASSELRSYDAIISDYLMPGMDGIAFLKAVRERYGDIPFILFTGRGREEVVIDAINNGADFYIQKGGDPRSQFAELAHKIRQSVRRKKAELERIRSEEKFSKLFVANPSLAAITDMATGRLLDVNDAFTRVTGYSRDEVIGKSTADINLFADYADREEMAKTLTGGGVVHNFETRIRTKSGEIRTLDFFGQCIRVGEKDLLFSQAVDITERKLAEEELRKSEERYRSVVNEQADLICRFSPDGTITFTNEAYRRYFRPVLGLDTIEGQNVFAIIREAGYHDGEHLIGSLTSERPAQEIERKISGKDGRVYWQRWSILPILDPDGKPSEYQVVGQDITAQKQAEEEISLKNAILLTQQGTSPDGILVVDGNRKILNVNQRFVRIWTIPDGLLTSDNDDPLLEYVTDQVADPDEFLSRVRHLYRHPEEKSFEEIALKDGRIIERYSLPMIGEGGKYYGRIWYFRDITGQKTSDEALFSSRQMLQAVLDNIPQRIFWKDRNLAFLGCNRPFARDVGFENPSDIVGKTDFDHSSRDLAERFRADDRTVMESGVPRIAFEEPQIRPDGSRAWLRTSKIPLRNLAGDIIGVLGMYEDITDMKRTEEALRESEEKFRRLAEKAPDMIYRMSLPEGNYEYVSPASSPLTGYTPEEFYADPMLITRLIHPGWREYLRQQFTALLEGDVPATYEYQIIDRAGRTRWVNQRNVLVRSGTGDPVAIEGIVTDITAQKEAEQELRNSERRFLAVTQNAGSWIWEMDPDGLYRYSSPAIEAILGYRPDEVVGKMHFYDLFDPSVGEELKEIALAAFKRRDPFRDFINLNRHKDGRPVLLKTSGTPVFADDGTFTGYGGVDEDITEQKRVEQALGESEERFRGMAERSSDLILVLNRSMSPEYVSPSVRSILGFAPEELVGKSPEFALATIFQKTGPGLMRAVEATMGGQLVENVELTVSRKDLTPVYVSLHAVPVLHDGVLEGVQVSMRDITEKKRADDALRESEAKFSSIFNSSPVALTLVSTGDGTIVDVNETFLQSSGYTRDEVIGRTVGDLALFSDPSDHERFVSVLKKEQAVRGMEIRCRRKTGEIQVCRFTSGIIRMGDRPFILSSVEDITDQKDSEDALKAMVGSMVGTTGSDSLQKIAENLSSWLSANCVMVGEIEPDRQKVDVLSMILDGKNITGFTYTLEGTPCENVAERGYCEYPDDAVRLFPKSRDLAELNIRGYAGTPLRNSQGSVMGILCIMSRSPLHLSPTVREIMDIIAVKAAAEIERMRMERTLHESEDRFRSFVDVSSDILYSATPEGILTYISPKWAGITGHDTTDILGGSFETLVVAEDLPGCRRLLQEVLSGKVARQVGEYRIRQGDGTLHWHSTNATAIRDADGTIIAIAGSIRDVTARKRAEEALRESEERFRSIVETSPNLIWEVDLKGHFRYISPTVTVILGYTPEEVIGKSILDLVSEENRPVAGRAFAQVIEPGRMPASFEIPACHRDGHDVVLEIRPSLTGPPGEGGRLRGVAIDITDRKKVEEALRESEKKFRSIVETSPDMIWDIDPRGIFRYISPVVREIMGYAPEDLIGTPITDLVREDARPAVLKALAKHFAAVDPLPPIVVPARDKDGRDLAIEIRSVRQVNEIGDVVGFRGVAIDITERMRSEEALRQSRHQLSEAMDIAHLADWEYDVATNLFTFNDRFYALYGTSAEREGGMQMSPETYAQEFIYPEDRHLVGVEIGKALNATDPGFTAQAEHRIIRRDGAVRHILVRIGVILDGNGKVIKTRGANQDITEQIQAEKALSRANKQLNLLGSITRHDTLNKISVILGYLNIADMKCTDQAVTELLKKIEDNTKVVRSQMEFTKVYQDLGTQEPKWISLDEAMPRSHVPSSITFTAELQGISVYADPMLEKVFFNLLDNAVRHGEHVTTIRVTSHPGDSDLIVVWEDNGVGVAENEKERIFERGFGRHTGLGMFLVREILALTGITIRETGEPEKGARFEITVPSGAWRLLRTGD